MNYPKNDELIYAVAMSGGIDSSLAAALMKQKSNNVFGFTMLCFDDIYPFRSGVNEKTIIDAKNVCDKLHVPHYTIDLRNEFTSIVINNFIIEYIQGRTPNPCTMCNRYIKWNVFREKIKTILINHKQDTMNIKFVTGHYAKIKEYSGQKTIFRAEDKKKDQTYMLWNLTNEQIMNTIFPLSEISKSDVRKLADDFNLNISAKKDSQDICFLEGKYTDFFSSLSQISKEKRKLLCPTVNNINSFSQGDIVFESNKKIGEHKGLIFYTIGQRKGLPSWKSPLYVLKIDAINNLIIVTDDENKLYSNKFFIKDVNQLYPFLDQSLGNIKVQIRYNSLPKDVLSVTKSNMYYEITLKEPAKSITPGQSAVFYSDDLLLGGGVIV